MNTTKENTQTCSQCWADCALSGNRESNAKYPCKLFRADGDVKKPYATIAETQNVLMLTQGDDDVMYFKTSGDLIRYLNMAGYWSLTKDRYGIERGHKFEVDEDGTYSIKIRAEAIQVINYINKPIEN